MDEKDKNDERYGLRLTAIVLLTTIIAVILLIVVTKGCTGRYEVVAAERADFEAIARLVELKDGVLTERRHETEPEKVAEGERHTVATPEERDESDATVCEDPHDEETGVDAAAVETEAPAYSVTNEYEAEMLARLTAYGIEWFYPYARATMFQESRMNAYAENPNGLDKGLLQYRITYWSAICVQHGYPAETSIFDWRVQVAIYVADTYRRLASGLSVQETISRHNTSDYGQYNAVYVQQVMQWVR